MKRTWIKAKKILKKWSLPFLLFVLFPIMILSIHLSKPSFNSIKSQIQKQFNHQEREIFKQQLALRKEWFSLSKSEFISRNSSPKKNVHLHIYHLDSLVFWNSNQMPVNRFADLHFPYKGMVKLQNGLYYSEMFAEKGYNFVFSLALQNEYAYENEHLVKELAAPFPKYSLELGMEEIPNKTIKSNDKKAAYSIVKINTDEIHKVYNYAIFICLAIYFVVFMWLVSTRVSKNHYLISIAALVVGLTLFILKNNWLSKVIYGKLSDPQLIAINEWLPNFASVFVGFVGFSVAFIFLWKIKRTNIPPILLFLSDILSLFLFLYLPQRIVHELIENSSISFDLSDLFSLDRYFFISLTMIGISYYILLRSVFFGSTFWLKKEKTWTVAYFVSVFVLLFGLYLFPNIHTTRIFFISLLLLLFVFSNKWLFPKIGGMAYFLFLTILVGAAILERIEDETGVKERNNREVYAKQLIEEQDLAAEMEFSLIRTKIQEESYFDRLIDTSNVRPNFNDLKEALERRIFNGFWDRYDVDCYSFDNKNTTINNLTEADFVQTILQQGSPSTIDSSLFYITEHQKKWSYIARIPLERFEKKTIVYFTFTSKRIPEEIGFPRLLISSQTNVLEPLEKYSMARYQDKKLVNNHGKCDYPLELNSLVKTPKKSYTFFDGQNDHYYYRKDAKNAIILSKLKTTWLERISGLAFIVVFFSLGLLLLTRFSIKEENKTKFSLSLANRIQISLLSLVMISLLSYTLGSGTFIQNIYQQNNEDLIREKIFAVQSNFLEDQKPSVVLAKSIDDLNFKLLRLSKSFNADINIYDNIGNLIASSRPKIYDIGIISEQMNAKALQLMTIKKKAKHIHAEKIGNLTFLSAYSNLIDEKNTTIGYLNLQHFNQQNAQEDQLKNFFLAIINVFMLLLIITVFFTLGIASWITAPLRIIRNSLAKVELGKHSEPIAYNKKDEIGTLVLEYNQKLKELEKAADQLAQSERESAWREMAKQVAHEIKNPLTPMKLSIQHLQRVFDPNDPNAAEKVRKVSLSIIEQIDGLTSIANSFASFAKMPQPIFEKIDLNSFISNAIVVFQDENKVAIHFTQILSEISINGDREMLLRVINNLITNGIQAVSYGKEAHIYIEIEVDEKEVIVRFIDNGNGIPEDKIATIFEPYFTTKSTGTGLGLAMVRQIIEGHQGTIWVEKSDQNGTEIRITLPIVV